MLRLDDLWVWDSWVADDGERYHLYFLQAPRSLGDPARRHTRATVGHAVSRDLVSWEYLGQTFGPGESGFDDLAVWTGSVVHDGRQWRMFYTAISTAGHHIFDQRIGSAVSDDLHHWRRTSHQPVLPVDPAGTRRSTSLRRRPPAQTSRAAVRRGATRSSWPSPPETGGTCSSPPAPSVPTGTMMGWWPARSHDLVTWEVGPPLCRPGAGFGQLEVLQSKVIDGRAVLVFTCHPQEMTPRRIGTSGEYCTWSVPSPGVTGPFDISLARPFTADPDLFAAPLVQRRDRSGPSSGSATSSRGDRTASRSATRSCRPRRRGLPRRQVGRRGSRR